MEPYSEFSDSTVFWRSWQERIFLLIYLVGVMLAYGFHLTYLPILLGAVLILYKTQKMMRLIGVALLFSALGDYAGMRHLFLIQIAFFAIAHLFYILFFCRKIFFNYRSIGGILAVVVEFGVLAMLVISGVDQLVERLFVMGYMLIIGMMGMVAMLNAYEMRRTLIIASQFFIVSDSLIAINRFVVRVPHAGLWIILTYYIAQGLFFWSAIRMAEKQKKSVFPDTEA